MSDSNKLVLILLGFLIGSLLGASLLHFGVDLPRIQKMENRIQQIEKQLNNLIEARQRMKICVRPGDYMIYLGTNINDWTGTETTQTSMIKIISISENELVTYCDLSSTHKTNVTQKVTDPLSDWTASIDVIPFLSPAFSEKWMPFIIRVDSQEGEFNKTYIDYRYGKRFEVNLRLSVKRSQYEWKDNIYGIKNVSLILYIPEEPTSKTSAKINFVAYYEESSGVLLNSKMVGTHSLGNDIIGRSEISIKLVETNIHMISL